MSNPSPFLKCVGGKSRLITQYEPLMPSTYKKYIEPFLGGGAMYLHLQPETAVLCEKNPAFLGAWSAIHSSPKPVIDFLARWVADYNGRESHEKKGELYYDSRAHFNGYLTKPGHRYEAVSSAHCAALCIFLNKTSYNGLWRVNQSGQYNAPHGRYKKPGVYDVDNLTAVHELLQSATLLGGDFMLATSMAEPGDFVFFDPPYMPLNKVANFVSYTRDGFTLDDQKRLACEFDRLTELGAYCMLANSNTDTVRELYGQHYVHEVQAARAINSDASARGKITELLITNYEVMP